MLGTRKTFCVTMNAPDSLRDARTVHRCCICGRAARGIWRMIGYDDFDELWICPACWEQHKADPHLKDVIKSEEERKDGQDPR